MSAPLGGEGLFASLKALAATLVATGKTRVELLSAEIAVEKERALRQLFLTQLLLFFLALAVVFGALLALLLFEAQRVLITGLLGLLFLLAAGLCWRSLARSSRRAAPPLADTLSELEEDLRRLKHLSGHDQSQGS